VAWKTRGKLVFDQGKVGKSRPRLPKSAFPWENCTKVVLSCLLDGKVRVRVRKKKFSRGKVQKSRPQFQKSGFPWEKCTKRVVFGQKSVWKTRGKLAENSFFPGKSGEKSAPVAEKWFSSGKLHKSGPESSSGREKWGKDVFPGKSAEQKKSAQLQKSGFPQEKCTFESTSVIFWREKWQKSRFFPREKKSGESFSRWKSADAEKSSAVVDFFFDFFF
jgi:hypothetical protein